MSYFKNLPRRTPRESLHSQSQIKGGCEGAVAGVVQVQTQGGSNASSSWNMPSPLYKPRLGSKAAHHFLLSPTTVPHFHPTQETHCCPPPRNVQEKHCEIRTEIKWQGWIVMGFPVSDQVDLVLPLLGLETMLGASVMANTTAAEDDDDGPHQPKPCSGGEQALATVREPHLNPGNPMMAMEKITVKPGSEPRTTLKAEIRVAPGGFDMDVLAWVTATLAVLPE